MGASVNANRLSWQQICQAILIGGAPVWMTLLIWDFTRERGNWQIFVRSNSLTVVAVELGAILVAMSAGFSPIRSILALPLVVKGAVLLWLPVTLYTSFQPHNDHLSAAIGLAKLFCAALLMLALVDTRQRTGNASTEIIWFGVGCGLLAYIVVWTIHIVVVGPKGEEWVVLVPGVNNVRHTGHFALSGFFAGLVCLFSYRRSGSLILRQGLPIFFATMAISLALWTGSRGPTLAIICGMIFAVSFGAGYRRQLCVFFALSTAIASIGVTAMPVPHRIYGAFGATAVADINSKELQDPSSGRSVLWRQTWTKVLEKPALGWGLEQFSKSGPEQSLGTKHPHNFPLQILFSGGVTLAVLLILIIVPLLRAWRWPNFRGPGLAGTSCIAGFAVYSLVDGVLFFSYSIMIFILAIATSINPSTELSARDKSD